MGRRNVLTLEIVKMIAIQLGGIASNCSTARHSVFSSKSCSISSSISCSNTVVATVGCMVVVTSEDGDSIASSADDGVIVVVSCSGS